MAKMVRGEVMAIGVLRIRGREWPPKFYEGSSAPHMEALGIIAAIYNHLEYTLFVLISVYSQLDNDVAKSLFERISNEQRLKFLRDCNENRTKDNPMHKHVIHFMKCFGIVADNRNVLMHSMILGSDDDEKILRFYKSSRAAPTIYKELKLDVSVLREVAFNLQDVDEYGSNIWLWCNVRAPWSKQYRGQNKIDGLAPPSATFLKKLALPKRLIIPDSQTPKAPKLRRVSPRQRRELAMKNT
jgi:hypothetical protein